MSFRYLGNKTRLTEWIVGEITRVLPPNSSIADPMCGTGAGSALLPLFHWRWPVLATPSPQPML